MNESSEQEHEAPTRALTYVVVAAILTVLTAMEVLVYNIRALQPVLVPVLLVLMLAKFALVAMFYMHLKFDDWLYTSIFVTLVFFAGAVAFSLVLLFLYQRTVHPPV
ncbi:MAG TPA: cytochrome C oxidase subunit IV family protein [Candidatus Binatia bacterium]|jgi:heme/copper-type cytochrome/quinol oxidase subunit 4|nr:cytochrome C oxidase subunit IV family protein [Candidatus Binatia bacterium]